MHYIVMDLEWNTAYCKKTGGFFNEVIEVGAVKLDAHFNTLDTISILIKPQVGKKLRGRTKEITHITNEELCTGVPFTQGMRQFYEWLGKDETNTFLSWGDGDIRVLIQNFEYFRDSKDIRFLDGYADVQKYCQSFMNRDNSQQVGLSAACEFFGVDPNSFAHHRALDDSLMTVECVQKVFDEDKLKKYVHYCDKRFYDMLMFKPYVIKDINNPAVDKTKFNCVCEQCHGKVQKKKKWRFINQSFRSEFYCPTCDKNFIYSVKFKQCFDRVEVKSHYIEVKPKESEPSKAIEQTV